MASIPFSSRPLTSLYLLLWYSYLINSIDHITLTELNFSLFYADAMCIRLSGTYYEANLCPAQLFVDRIGLGHHPILCGYHDAG